MHTPCACPLARPNRFELNERAATILPEHLSSLFPSRSFFLSLSLELRSFSLSRSRSHEARFTRFTEESPLFIPGHSRSREREKRLHRVSNPVHSAPAASLSTRSRFLALALYRSLSLSLARPRYRRLTHSLSLFLCRFSVFCFGLYYSLRSRRISPKRCHRVRRSPLW